MNSQCSPENGKLSQRAILVHFEKALKEEQFLVYYQPIYNHSTGMLVGMEALVRWRHPEFGMIPPLDFIPVLEDENLIPHLDLYVFDKACRFLKKAEEMSLVTVPISTNIARHDIFFPGFVDRMEQTRLAYGVPARLLRVEITESSAMGDVDEVNFVIRRLHELGYTVEMDDFGSGYSSLNVLKDLETDIIKLDMNFLKGQIGGRGGTIISSVVRMAKWLGMPLIAEGVETVEQADFMRSIGCDYIQGYLYSKPLPEEETTALLARSRIGITIPKLNLIDSLNAVNFWDPRSQETLIFNNYVGGAAIMDYCEGHLELLRVNAKYVQEIGMNLSEKELILSDPWAPFDENNKKIYIDMMETAIRMGDEQECETWRTFSSSCCGNDHLCIRTNARVIGRSDNHYLFYAMVRNVTAEKNELTKLRSLDNSIRYATEQVNMYFWEYTVASKEMRPCFRCMRDLGLPPLVQNYPEPAIDLGIFPQDYADMYRDWHRKIEQGVAHLEAVIPLTVGRVPFRVRYTTAFDENGRPVKAYGSATLVVDEKTAQ